MSGGIGTYYGFLEIMRDPKNKEYSSMMEWWGGEFDPEEFDIDEANKILRRIK